MKQVLFYLIISITIFYYNGLLAQNAFYDAKRIEKLIQSDNTKEILPILMNYKKDKNTFPWDRFASKYPDHIGEFKKKYNALYESRISQLLENTDNIRLIISKIPNGDNALGVLNKTITDLEKARSDFKLIDALQKKLEQKLTNHELVNEQEFLSMMSSSRAHENLDSSQLAITSLYSSDDTTRNLDGLEILYTYSVELRQNQLSYISTLKENIKQLIYDEKFKKYFINEPEALTQSSEAKTFFELLSNEKALSEKSFQEANFKPASSFKVPSQAEMIDALAIYLSKRVKQEITLSFIEKLSDYIQNQPLMSTLFPSTLKLLNQREAFMRPHFGTSWQISMSEDFIKLPERLPECLPYRYKHLDKYLTDAVRIGRLVEHHYSFIEAVNNLNDEPLKTDPLQHANSLIYILNHEFYSAGNNKNYWIGADQLQSMNKDQLEWLYILLDLKYGDKINSIMSKEWKGKSVWNENYFATKVMPLRNYLTKIIIQLNYFENEIANASLQNQSGSKSSALNGYWKFQNDLMNVVIDTQFLNIPSKSLAPLELTKGVFTLYSAVESKNYPMLVNQLLQLLSKLDFDKRTSLQDIVFTNSMSKALQQKDTETRNTIFNYFQKLNNSYDFLVSSNTLKDIRDDFTTLNRLVEARSRKDILKNSLSTDEANERIVKLIKNGYRGSLDSIFFTDKFLNQLQNDKRQKDIETQVAKMNFKFAQLKTLHLQGQSALENFDSLKTILKQNNLDKSKYFKISPARLHHFISSKIFSLDASENHNFLYRMDSRQHYQKIRSSLSFLADVMQTNGSQELSKVIESYSLPPSSYKIKRFSRFSLNVDALVGGFVGIETIKDGNSNLKSSFAGGLSAPIGLSMSWGKRSMLRSKKSRTLSDNESGFVNKFGNFKLMKGYNTTLLFTVIDIGAPVSYRITNTTEGGLPGDAKWSQLFSPGVMALVGLKGLPLCVGSGVRFTPNLRNVGQGLQSNALRFDLGLYFDLPLINLYYR